MKKLFFAIIISLLAGQQIKACTYYNPDYGFYSLFAQELIQEPAYYPFLLSYDSTFYGEDDENAHRSFVEDENIVAWQHYFKDELTYEETNALLKIIRLKHLKNWKKGKLSHVLSKQMGAKFYQKYKEGFDYLIVAKSLEPYMRITAGASNLWYENTDEIKTAGDLPFTTTLNSLTEAYKSTHNKEIKLRYGYQIVRFLHYTRNYKDAVAAFDKYVQNNNSNTPIYWHALNQMAGALRGMGNVDQANYYFLKVFQNSNTLKDNAFLSIELNQNYDLQNLLRYTKTTEEKNLVYFLLAYRNYSNPVPIMQKMMHNNADSEILKVLTARAINELERIYLPVNQYCWDENCSKHKNKLLPIASRNSTSNQDDFILSFKNMIKEIGKTSNDAYWDLTLAHLHFLLKDYAASDAILNKIKTTNPQYQEQISQMKMLNDIVRQKKIDKEFEKHLMVAYPDLFKKESSGKWRKPTTLDFVKDILANRYFLEKKYAKAFLLNNDLYEIQYNPQIGLVRRLDKFYKKANKNTFESYLAQNSTIGFKNTKARTSFFNLIYGDYAMRNGKFDQAVNYYSKISDFDQIPRYYWDNELVKVPANKYDGFNNVSPKVFGVNNIECFNCPERQTIFTPRQFSEFVPNTYMTKLTLAKTVQRLEDIGNSSSPEASIANEMIGNLLYNTSALGYFRELFVLDLNNANSPKYNFGYIPSFKFYYKNYANQAFAEKGNFDLTINYYKKALEQTQNKEHQAGILFQMARAEQGQFYLWRSNQSLNASWSDDDYKQKHAAHVKLLTNARNTEFRTYFDVLKNNYAQTRTVARLRKTCSYLNHYMKKD